MLLEQSGLSFSVCNVVLFSKSILSGKECERKRNYILNLMLLLFSESTLNVKELCEQLKKQREETRRLQGK